MFKRELSAIGLVVLIGSFGCSSSDDSPNETLTNVGGSAANVGASSGGASTTGGTAGTVAVAGRGGTAGFTVGGSGLGGSGMGGAAKGGSGPGGSGPGGSGPGGSGQGGSGVGGRGPGGSGQGGSGVGGRDPGGSGPGGSGQGGSGVGGSAQGGSGVGGQGTGGAPEDGGAPSAGTGTGGEATAGGTSTDPVESPGCGSAAVPDPCDTDSSPCTLDIDGTEREFYVALPDDYDASRAYPVVFQFHPLGGNGRDGMTMYRVRPNFPDAIYVSPQGLVDGQYAGFPNTDGGDEALTRAIMADIEAQYCVDKSRYFSTGFSYGGSMSYTAACNMSDVFRAVAAMAGAPISGANCAREAPERRVAFWGSHGTEDEALPIDMAYPIRDAFVERNGCTDVTVDVDPSPCVEYQGCDDGYPVVWCEVVGQTHAIPDYGPTAIAAFFQQF